MKRRNIMPCALALAVLGALILEFPPFQMTWHRFVFDLPQSPVQKGAYLLRVYGLPFCISFFSILLMQLQGRLAMGGAAAASVFPVALFGAAGMMTAFRSMVNGVGGVPGYALGMALAYTVGARIHSIQPSGRMVLGRPMLRIVWRGQLEAQMHAASRVQARPPAPEPEQRMTSSSASNSAKNSSLSLSRAEAGI